MIYQSVAIVTGASRGLGAATARWLSKAKAGPVLVARHKDRLVTQQDRIRRAGGMCLTIPADVTVPDACRRVAQTVLEQFGRIDILINNAAVLEPIAPISRANVGLWRRSLETNVLGPLLMTRAALPSIRKMKGRIINISSGVVDRIFVGWSAYCTTKAALNQLTRSTYLTMMCTFTFCPTIQRQSPRLNGSYDSEVMSGLLRWRDFGLILGWIESILVIQSLTQV